VIAMSLLDRFFRKRAPTASVAKERLQIVLSHERANRDTPEFLPLLKLELLAVVGKYLDVADDMIKVHLERHAGTSVLEINVEMDKAKIRQPRPVEEGFVPWTAR
jgi:cell division topological specificity factor